MDLLGFNYKQITAVKNQQTATNQTNVVLGIQTNLFYWLFKQIWYLAFLEIRKKSGIGYPN